MKLSIILLFLLLFSFRSISQSSISKYDERSIRVSLVGYSCDSLDDKDSKCSRLKIFSQAESKIIINYSSRKDAYQNALSLPLMKYNDLTVRSYVYNYVLKDKFERNVFQSESIFFIKRNGSAIRETPEADGSGAVLNSFENFSEYTFGRSEAILSSTLEGKKEWLYLNLKVEFNF